MANLEHLAILKQGTQAWNAWRKNLPAIQPDLSGVDLSRADLQALNLSGAVLSWTILGEARLSKANLSGANLFGADLAESDLKAAEARWTQFKGARLVEANLDGANLFHADLREGDLSRATLRDANLTQATLFRTILNEVNLNGANLTAARFWQTYLTNLDLSTVKGLEAVRHEGPSEISISTMYRSKGNIPELFLREAGVPENLVNFMRSLTGKAFAFYSAFISYSSQDQAFAEQLHANLQAKGVRVWFAPEDLKIGDPIKQTIDEAVRLYDKLILVLSANSIDRAWVRHEFSKAIEKEKGNKHLVLFPIRLDDSVFETTEQWAYDIRQRHIGDFRNWKNHDDYQRAIERLLRDLQAA